MANVSNYIEPGGDRTVVGGSLDVVSGGELDIESGGALKIGGVAVTATAAELNAVKVLATEASYLDGVTPGTSAASKAVVLDANSKISALDITALKLGGTSVTATAAELNILDTVTATAAELNYVADVTAGTAAASKAVVLDASAQIDALTIVGAATAGSAEIGGGYAGGSGTSISAAGVITTNGAITTDAAITATDVNASGQMVFGRTAKAVPIQGVTVTDYDAQAATATIAALRGGIVTQNSQTGASTITTPTGAEITAGITGAAAGDSFTCLYCNRGDQTSTITAGASGVTLAGTAAVPTLKTATLTFVCTAADTWSCYIVLSA